VKSSPTLMSVSDVAEALRVSPHTVRRWIAQKKLAVVKLGTRTLFDPKEVTRFVRLAANNSKPPVKPENGEIQ